MQSLYLLKYEALSLLRALPPNHLILSEIITMNNNQSLKQCMSVVSTEIVCVLRIDCLLWLSIEKCSGGMRRNIRSVSSSIFWTGVSDVKKHALCP